MGDNDPFQPQSAASQDQNKKHPFRRWLIAAAVGLIIGASIGGFYLHWGSTYPTLYASYRGYFSSPCDPPDAMNWVATFSLDQVVEDPSNGTFTALMSESGACGCTGSTSGSVTPSGNVRFTCVLDSVGCGNTVSYSGTIQSQTSEFSTVGGINGQIYFCGTHVSGNFQLAPAY